MPETNAGREELKRVEDTMRDENAMRREFDAAVQDICSIMRGEKSVSEIIKIDGTPSVSKPRARDNHQLERIRVIHEKAEAGEYPNCSDLAKLFKCNRKTVLRDIKLMRSLLQMPLEYDEQNHGYHYPKAITCPPMLEVGEESLTVMFLIKLALEPVRGTPFAVDVQGLLSKLLLNADKRVKFAWDDFEKVFSRSTSGSAVVDAKAFGRLGDALLRQHEVRFGYKKHGAKRAEQRNVRPYHMGEIAGCWYLIGYDLDREALCTFALPRIKEVKVLSDIFTRPEDFDGKKYFSNSFGIWSEPSGEEHIQEVRVELRGYAARLAHERRWHPSQQVIEVPDRGGDHVVVRFQVTRIEEVVQWVLGWGSQARPLAPQGLVDAVRREIMQMSEPWK